MTLMSRENAPSETSSKNWENCCSNTKQTFGRVCTEFALKTIEMLAIKRQVANLVDTGTMSSATVLQTNTNQFSSVRWLATWAKIAQKIFYLLLCSLPLYLINTVVVPIKLNQWQTQKINLKKRVRSLSRFRASIRAIRRQTRLKVLMWQPWIQLINRRRRDM